MKWGRKLVGVCVLAVVAWVIWQRVPPVLVITAPAGQFTTVELAEGESLAGWGKPCDLASGRAELPLRYGKQVIRLTFADGRRSHLFYAHVDAAVRRRVTMDVQPLAGNRCQVKLSFNGIPQELIEFDLAEAEERAKELGR